MFAELDEPPVVSAGNRCAGLDLDRDYPAVGPLQDEIYVFPVALIVVEAGSVGGPAEVLEDLHRDEILQDPAGELIVERDSRLVGAQQRREQARVSEIDLWRARLSYPEAWPPCPESSHEEQLLQEPQHRLSPFQG